MCIRYRKRLILITIPRSSSAVGYAVATFDSTVKCIFGTPLRKRLDARKVTETPLKNDAHNFRRIEYLEIIDDIALHWAQNGGHVNLFTQ